MVRGWVIEQVCLLPHGNVMSVVMIHIPQMLEFRMANTTAGGTGRTPSSAYKSVPGNSTSALSGGLDRLFGPVSTGMPSRGNSSPSVSAGQRQEQESADARERQKARGLVGVHRELDEYLEEPLETFSRTERVGGTEQRVIFDPLTYWQVRVVSPDIPPAAQTLLYCRTQKGDFQISSVLRWMFSPHKRAPCHASDSSHPGRRPAPLAETESTQNSWKPSRF